MATATNAQLIAGLYTAFFDRAPDQSGLQYWENAFSGEATIADLAGQFAEHPVFTETYADQTDEQFVQAIYQNVLGAAGEASGVAYWVDQLSAGVSRADMVASFVNDALTLDLSEFTDLSAEELAVAQARQDALTNKVNVGLHFVEKFGAASNLSADTDTTTKAGLEADPVYLASQAAIAGVTADAASVAAANAAIDAAASPADLNEGEAFTLTEALAAETLPEVYSLSDATADLGALAIADVAAAQAAAAAVVAGAANAAELEELAVTYTIADTLANVLAADAAVLAAAGSYSLSDTAGALGELTEAEVAVVLGAENATDFTYTPAFTLTKGLEDLQAAQAAKADFLEEAAEIDFVKAATTGATTEAKIAQAVIDADTVVAGVNYTNSSGTLVTVYALGDSDGVKAAKVADAQAQLAEDLTTAQEALADAQADVAKVSGLSSAVDLYNARVEAQKVTAEALKAAKVVEASAQGAYDAQNAAIVPNPTTGVVASVIVQNATSGRLELASGVTETTNPGIGALLAAVQARVDAAGIDKQAQDAIEAAVIAIGYIDTATTDKDDIGAAFVTPVAGGADSDKLTQAQIQVELNAQLAAAEELGELTIDPATGLITHIDSVTIGTEPEVVSFNKLKGEVNTFEGTLVLKASGEYTFATTVETQVQIAEQTKVANAEAAIEALAEAVADLTAAKEVAAELKAFDDAITAAEDAFEDLGVEVPATIDGTVIGTAENDVFLASDKAGTVVNFNAQGEDSIFFGTDFAGLVTLGSTEVITNRVGDAAVLEIFAKQNGSNVDLYVEQETFAGNGTSQADIVKITLSGVSVEDLVLADGFLTLA